MGYTLAEQNGESVAVPRLVFAHLGRADGDTIRVALYLLGGGGTDPRTIAHDLGLSSQEKARRALQYWAGAGLLVSDRSGPVLPSAEQKAAAIDLSTINDPYVSVLCEEAQTIFGKALSRGEMQRLVALYLNDGWQPDVILTCCSEVARQGRRTIGALSRELLKWRDAGVETGEDAEKYLRRQAMRDHWCEEAARLFGIEPSQLTRWERSAVARWHEDWQFGADMIEEALLHAENHRTVRYVDGILRSWKAQGLTTVQAVRGKGQLSGSNILATGTKPAAPKTDLFQTNWNAVFDDDTEG